MNPKLYIKTFGCQMNTYDSDKMADVLRESGGYERTDTPDDADLFLLNTCSVREKAQARVYSELGRWKQWKEDRPGRMIGVGGCVASQEGQALADRVPVVDVVFGPQTLHRLPELLAQARRDQTTTIDISFPEIEKFDRLPEAKADGATAFVSIMEGCSKYCTFCVVPYTRGEEISRPFDSVFSEVEALLDQGVREITLLGQNVNAYRGEMADGTVCDLALLIDHLAQFDALDRIRFTTSHPVEFTDSLVECFAEQPKLASYLHLPVQSGSDRILAMMKRGHTRDQYLEKIRRIREARPDISLSSDFIVGFPSETEADFAATMELIAEARFDCAFSFIYSERPGTPAAALADRLSDEEKHQRLNILQHRIRQYSDAYCAQLVGTVQPVLIERASRKGQGQIAGRTPQNRWVNFDGSEALINQIVDVQITEVMPNSLQGRLLSGAGEACPVHGRGQRV